MAVQQEIKSQLAKLLATEDLVVEHKQVECAQFNVHTRVLVLPLWEKASNDVYDMLVGHEVGHALFTPDEDPPEDVPHQFINVVEDARIEKLMKRKYMGLAKSFYKGYSELYEQDFFELDGEDITSFNLADRANLYFKVGHFLDLAFLPAEKEIVDMIGRCETFDDSKKAAFVLYQYCLEQQKKEQEETESKIMEPDSGEGESFSDEFFDDGKEEVGKEQEHVEEPEVQTAESLDSKLQELVNSGGVENEYIEVQKVNLDTIIVSNQDIHLNIGHSWHDQGQIKSKLDPVNKKIIYTVSDEFVRVDTEFYKFKKDAQKEVSYLVKEFECRKSASAYIRSATNRTGVLDTKKLQTYKFNEDLFKKVTIVPDGKNHGLVFILDWSGSMQYVLQDTIKQLYNLLWFCRKVQIPFEVYAFTNEYRRQDQYQLKHHYERKEGVFHIEDEFNLMNLFTSKVNGKTLEYQMINIWRIVTAFKEVTGYNYPDRLILSGTPLNEALISLHQILPKFQKENKLEKVQCIVLTDGEANPLPYHKTVQRSWESEPYLGCRNINPNKCFLRDRKLGRTYKMGYRYHDFTDVLLNNLKDRFPSTNFIGIRVLSPRDANSFMRLYKEDHSLTWKKNRSFIIHGSGYDAYFALSSTTLAQDAEFDVESDATKAQIKKAFVKSFKIKKLNKKVLCEFIELVV